MILRRITEALRRQDWVTVTIETMIVVLGVFLGLQVNNWNEARVERARLTQQLDSLRIEMESNLLRIDAHRSWSYNQVETSNKLRQMLSGDLSKVDASFFDSQLLELQIIRTFVPELSAYQELAESGGLRRLNRMPLRDALARWQEALAALQRLDRDALIHRDDVRANYLLTSLSQAALIEQYAPASGKLPPSRFRNDIEALASDVRMENFLAMRAAFGAGIPAYLNDLEDRTERVIALLENPESAE